MNCSNGYVSYVSGSKRVGSPHFPRGYTAVTGGYKHGHVFSALNYINAAAQIYRLDISPYGTPLFSPNTSGNV